MPSVQVGALAASNFAQAVMLTLPFTVGVYAVRDWFPGSGEELVGQRTGLLAAAYALSQTLTGYAWGTWSSRHGRKPVMLLGNAASAASLVWFGLAGSYGSAAAARAAAGLLNAIIVAFKCMVGESCDALEQGRVMSLMTLSWGIGCVVGPLIGGAFSRPCDLWPRGNGPLGSLCDPDGLFMQRPYLLPCLLAAAFNAASFVANIFILEETLPAIVLRRRARAHATAHSAPTKPSASAAAEVAGGGTGDTGGGSGGLRSLPEWWRRWAARHRPGGAAGGYARLRAVSVTAAAEGEEEQAAFATELARFDSAADMLAAKKRRQLLKGNGDGLKQASGSPTKAGSGGGDGGVDRSGCEGSPEQRDTEEPRDCGNGGNGGGNGKGMRGVDGDCDVRVQRIDSEWLLRSYRRAAVKAEEGSFCCSSSSGGSSSGGSDGEPEPGSPVAQPSPRAAIVSSACGHIEDEDATQRLLPLGAAAARSDGCGGPAKNGSAPGSAVAAVVASSVASDAGSRGGGSDGGGGRQWWRDRRVVLSLVGYGCVCLVFILIDEVVPIFASAPVDEGGLQMAEADLSAPLAAGGLTLITFTLLCYPPLQRIFGTLPLTRAGLALAALAAAAAPLPSLAAGAGVRVTGALLAAALALKNIAHCCAFNGAMVVLNVVCDPAQLGAVNGAGQTLASLVRGLGPLAGGALWGAATRAPAGGQFGVFGLIAAVAAAALGPFFALRVEACEAPKARRHATGATRVATEEA